MTDVPGMFQIVPLHLHSQYLTGAAELYAKTWNKGQEWAYDFFARYARKPDFTGLVAVFGGEAIGYVFGVASKPGNWWFDVVAQHVPPTHPGMQDAFELVELAVAEPFQNHGIGSQLLTTILKNQPLPRALLSTEANNWTARRFYERLGWGYLHRYVLFGPDKPPFVIMHKELQGSPTGD